MSEPAVRAISDAPPARGPWRQRWGPRQIRGKLIFLHTMFSLGLAVILMLAIRPAISDIVQASEERECLIALDMLSAAPESASAVRVPGVSLGIGSAAQFDLPPEAAAEAQATPGAPVLSRSSTGGLAALRWDPAGQRFLVASARNAEAHEAVNRLFLILTIALLAVYALIALTLEVFVLPRQVYEPVELLLRADEAVQRGERSAELIAESQIPRDELGQIMTSRNQAIVKLREQERALAEALQRLEVVAGELHRKNHLLETARRNLADQDRLASLGMMSAGLAHELNTPLAVLKGCVEELASDRTGERTPAPERVALMRRVVGRLERLSESLLDFARARPPASHAVPLRDTIEEAWTLVSIDRAAGGVRFDNRVEPSASALGDPDRLVQVMVNLLRNAVDAMDGGGRVSVSAERGERDGRRWVSVTIADSGPGIEPALFPRLFEPFASTRLDAQGTGLGLAVAEGIVREHGGVLLARNAPEGGAVFEVMLPEADPPGPSGGLFERAGATAESGSAVG